MAHRVPCIRVPCIRFTCTRGVVASQMAPGVEGAGWGLDYLAGRLVEVSGAAMRTNIERLVGGATEETIIARVGEGIVSTIGSSATYKEVLEKPDRISETVLTKGLDAGTAFEILSIGIVDVDIGQNTGARLQADQAEADKRVAQAKAEEDGPWQWRPSRSTPQRWCSTAAR